MNIKVDDRLYIKTDKPQSGDLFVAVRRNNHQTPYVIASSDGEYMLINLNSGYPSTYCGGTIEKLINNYIKKNTNYEIIDNKNPIISYFFCKSHNVNISVKETFGYAEISKGEGE